MILLVDPEYVTTVQRALAGLGVWSSVSRNASGEVALTLAPYSSQVSRDVLVALHGVRSVLEPASPHPRLDGLAGRPVAFGRVEAGVDLVLAAGPCAVESPEQIDRAAAMAAKAGARVLRGGAYKPRTSPYSFQGKGREALGWLRSAADRHGLAVVTEVMSEGDVAAVAECADLVQIGSRSMQSFSLLRAAGGTKKPVLLKRGGSARLDEWRLAAEHLLAAGAPSVIFCERGVVGFDGSTRNLLDLGAVALLKHVDHHVVWVDPSHASGRRDLIIPLAKAAVGAGADGIIVESHPEPSAAESDGPQALDADGLEQLARALGLRLGP